ncbi:MAG: VOC family protein [Scytolyngbya sp. HA4215-MV1]|nr:VOC family protein [Scytolyngbya sp. HA4215-MV1]
MRSSLTCRLKRSLLSALVFATVVVSPQLQAISQVPRSLRSSTPAQLAQTQPVQNAVVAVESVGMTVFDMDRTIEFYTQVLSFQKVSDVEVLGTAYEQLQGIFGVRLRIVRMRLGDEFIDLTEYLTPRGRPIPIDSRSHDRWFQHIAIVVSDMDKAYLHLRQYKVQHASTAPQRLPASIKEAAGIRAFYFKDPDGHNLEIINFPPDKGNPKWHKPTHRLFLGIDHTAIVVSSTAASLKFYQDLLGLKLAGESMNEGTEQAHLNNVEGARLHISGLRSPAGPGIEFLEYLYPQDGRPYPVDARPNDLLNWQTTLVVKDLAALTQQLRLHRSTFLSPDIVSIPEPALGFKKGILVRDPDGHVVRLVEK